MSDTDIDLILPSTIEDVQQQRARHVGHITGSAKMPWSVLKRMQSASLPDVVEENAEGSPFPDVPSMRMEILRLWLMHPLTRWTHWYTYQDGARGDIMPKDWATIDAEANPDDLDYIATHLHARFFTDMYMQMFKEMPPVITAPPELTKKGKAAKTTAGGNGQAAPAQPEDLENPEDDIAEIDLFETPTATSESSDSPPSSTPTPTTKTSPTPTKTPS